MKAAVYDMAGDPRVLKYIEVPDPICGPDDVLILVHAISIEGGDLINRRTVAPPTPSWVLGYAGAGKIVAIGSRVSDRKVGDRVAAFDMQGSHAQLWAVPATRTWRVRDDVDLTEAAAIPISFGTANHCLFARGGLKAGETVLIQAASGGVGIAAVQLAAEAGAEVIAIASGEERGQRLRALGAAHVIDRNSKDVVEAVRELTGNSGVDFVIDPVGTTLQTSLAALGPEGRLVFVGNAGGGDLTVDLWPPMQSNQTLLGVFMGSLFEKPAIHLMVNDMFNTIAEVNRP